jgi:hypothetical protein
MPARSLGLSSAVTMGSRVLAKEKGKADAFPAFQILNEHCSM